MVLAGRKVDLQEVGWSKMGHTLRIDFRVEEGVRSRVPV